MTMLPWAVPPSSMALVYQMVLQKTVFSGKDSLVHQIDEVEATAMSHVGAAR